MLRSRSLQPHLFQEAVLAFLWKGVVAGIFLYEATILGSSNASVIYFR